MVNTWFVSWMIVLGVTNASRRGTGELVYKVNFQKLIDNCESIENNVLNLSDLIIEYESASSSYLKGNVTISVQIEKGTKIEIEAFKEVGPPVGREFIYIMTTDLCEHIAEDNTPWGVIFNSMGIRSCPIEAKDYVIERLKFDLDYAKDMMRHEYTGDYYAKISLLEPPHGVSLNPEILSCHTMAVGLHEVKSTDK